MALTTSVRCTVWNAGLASPNHALRRVDCIQQGGNFGIRPAVVFGGSVFHLKADQTVTRQRVHSPLREVL